MRHLVRASALALSLVGLILVAVPTPAQAGSDPIYTGFISDLAVSGYDPVAYFTEGQPVEGSADHEYEWIGATWRFASAENQEAFEADPEAYAPQYGGYCSYAVSYGSLVSTDPQAWRIVDGKLYLNYSQDVQKTWEQDIPGYIGKADANWPAILDG